MGRPLYLWPPCVAARCGHCIFCPVVLKILLSIYLSSVFHRLISAVADWMSAILAHMVGLSANLGCRSETCCTWLAENTGRKKSPKIRHLSTIAQLCRTIYSQLRHVSTVGKQQYLPHMSLPYGELRPTSGWDRFVIWGTPGNFDGFRVLAALLHGTLEVGVSQTLRRWTAGRPSLGIGPHSSLPLWFLSFFFLMAALRSGCGHYIFIMWFILSFFFFSLA